MDYRELVADNWEDYANKAVALASDPQRRQRASQAVLKGCQHLREDQQR